jgi:hypothetical protein
MLRYLNLILLRIRRTEEGLATAELLGNAALGVAALVVIWAALRILGLDIVDWIRAQVMG